jgi:hypothetical protein
MSRTGWMTPRAPRRRSGSQGRGVPTGRVAAAAIPVLLAAAAGAQLLPARAPAAGLSADAIVAKNVAARGGLEAWRKVETMVWLGHIESSHAPLPSMPFKLDQKRPNKTRLEIHALGDKSLRVFDGVQGWKVRPTHGAPDVQPYAPQELRFARDAHGIDGPLIDHAEKGASVTLAGVEELGGRKTYHLRIRLATGGDEDVWVDAETYLDVRYDRMAEGTGGTPRRVSATYGDYRAVEGLKIPFLITTGGGKDTTPDRMQIETVVLNAPLGDATFGNPVAPHASHRARASIPPRAPAPAAASPAPTTPPTPTAEERGPAPP